MKDEIGISIIIPCYNTSEYITNCLDSIRVNNYRNYEVVIVNDKSTDSSVDVINRYRKQYPDMPVQLFCNSENLGAGQSRNIGISISSKEYLLFIDADDAIAPNTLVIIDETIGKNNKCDCLIFNADKIYNEKIKTVSMFASKKIVPGKIKTEDALAFLNWSTWGKVYKASIIKENKIEFGLLKRREDMIFTKLAVSYCKNIFYISDVLYHYYDRPMSLMNNKSLNNVQYAFDAFNAVEASIDRLRFKNELNILYYISVVYSVMNHYIVSSCNTVQCKCQFKELMKNNIHKNQYFHKLRLKYRIAFYCYKFNLFWLIGVLKKKQDVLS